MNMHHRNSTMPNANRVLQLGNPYPLKHIAHKVPADSAIASGMHKMGDKERASVTKLMDIAYFIALKGRLFADFKYHIALEKLHEVKFDVNSYENETACWHYHFN